MVYPEPDLDHPVSSAISASSPPFHPTDDDDDEARQAPALLLSSPPSGDSSSSAAGSHSAPNSPRSIALEPPSLPVFSALRETEESQSSSPDHRRKDSGLYYTTTWGSPYAAPSSRRLSLTLSQYAGVDHGSGASSPAPASRRSSNAPEGDPAAQNEDKSIRDFTQDWINQYLSGQPRSERTNWLSDDSGSEAPSFLAAQQQQQLADDGSDDWLGLEGDIRDDDDLLKTPTLSDFVGRSAAGLKKKLHKRAETLRQEDFWGFAYDQDSPQNIMSDIKEMEPSAEAEVISPTSPVEKPLPPAPADGDIETLQEQPEAESKPALPKRHKSQASIHTPRRRKKLAWRGKACIVDLPVDDKRGSEQHGTRLLTPADVQERLKQWEDDGWDVRGFSIGSSEDPTETTDLGGLSRPLYPDPAEMQTDPKSKEPVINFPNKAVWDAYVADLQEEKLRALGVSFAEPEPEPSMSPAEAAMSQTHTPFPGLVGSPPLPTASAGSNPLAPHHPFSPHFGQSTATTSGGMGSLASPASQFSVQTPFMGVEQNYMPGYPFQFQPTPPAQSITPQSLLNARQANSSAGPGGMHNFSSMLSPVSPLHGQNPFHQGFDGAAPSKDIFSDQFGQTHADGPPFPMPQTPINAPPDQFHASNVEIAQPTPRGHGHNLSETLQRGLDQMGHPNYHLEESIERQLDEDDHDTQPLKAADLLNSRWALPENDESTSGQPPHSFAQQAHQFFGDHYLQDNGHEGSDFDTNPSLSGTPQHRGAPWNSGHHSKLSTSSLNVEAKEFNPTSSFGSQASPFSNSAFQFGGMGEQHGFGGFAAAPAFAPAGLTHGSMDSTTRSDAKPKSSFKFSAASFNVEAPEFNPSASLNSTASTDIPSVNRTKIFGDIDLSEISKPPKKSKAIPIVRPDEVEKEKKDDENVESEDINGRPVPTDRHKRARRGIGHAQGEARYSISTHPLGDTGNAQASSTLPTLAEGKENALPEDRSIERKGTPVSEATTWTLFDAKNDAEAARSNTASPAQPEQAQEPKVPEETVTDQAESELAVKQENGPPADSNAVDHAAKESVDSSKNTLSATAAPFEFKPAVSEFVPETVQPSSFAEKASDDQVPLIDQKPAEKKKKGGLMASRFASDTPPPQPKEEEPSPSAQQLKREIGSHYPTRTPEPASRQVKNLNQDSGLESPDDEELNAIMEQLNGDDSDVGIVRQTTPPPPQHITDSVGGPTKEQRFGSADARGDAPSPSPGGGQRTYKLDIPKLGSDVDAQSVATFSPQKSLVSRLQSPVRQLITENDHVSDWDDMISSGEDEKFMNRNRFFDRRINDLVGSAIDDRLGPMERALGVIQQSVASIAAGSASRRVFRSTSAEIEDSDADDEDDEGEHEHSSVRGRSPHHMRDRKLDMLKNVVLEALATHDLPTRSPQHSSHSEIALLKESIAELQALTIKKLAQDPVGDMREILEETLAKQLAANTPRMTDAEEIGADSLMLQIESLKTMLRMADERAEAEYKQRREAQETVVEFERRLKVAEEDTARHSAAAEDAETRFLQFKEEKIPYFEKMQFRSDTLAEEAETLKVTIAELSSKNIALQGDLDEYRVSSDNYRKQLSTTLDENKTLHETIDHLRVRIEDNMAVRQNLTEKFDRLQQDMVNATHDIGREQATSRRKEEEQTARYNELYASYTREVKLREKLEQDVNDLELQERESNKVKFMLEQSHEENEKLNELVTNLRNENHEMHLKAARFERELNDSQETHRLDIQRTKAQVEAEADAANSQAELVRAELEAQILRLQSQLETATESKETALDDQRRMHERVLNDLRERHGRALHNGSEDRQRGESHLMDRLALSDDKVKHLQERVQHLEEKLEIAQSAARAAAEAARSGKAPSTEAVAAPAPAHAASPSMSFSKGTLEPEKISPQALRESIMVLQDQLQQRETRIEELEQEASTVDKDAPNKIKERDTEITWLREVLGVRIDDLQDIIRTLSQPNFNKHAVRDAAIRLKANLQMQQQERERAMSGNNLSLPSISDLAASPRSLPLAAAAAWGNWRKARDNSNSGLNPSDQTPSKSNNAAGGFLSGLLTPPGSHVRQNAPPHTAAPARTSSYRETRPLRGFNSTPRRGSVLTETAVADPPQTPPLLRRSSYDHDAEPGNYEEDNFLPDDIESTVGGLVSATSPSQNEDDGPFGPRISTEPAPESPVESPVESPAESPGEEDAAENSEE
ncbi:hypothetical protein N7474_000642 [Penicillium riverlandense]|uniref:uncharacterized protein n=1 Tax=Penicillium riverlandense TaxID=1903569 RepID=UPI0025481A28|nr:uncharacterized protein N7474_000642 [Penicillium riverlandense]KAJ5832331.1 hypothetical protein N7474_000642 [Penicillium riverlandense]